MAGTLISACLMVRDESTMLNRCLKSVKHLVDEIIVVDTGSTDNTIEIANHHGAKVYRHPWENNFSTHRNQSISYATGEWVFIIDADEELVKSDAVSWADLRMWFTGMLGKYPAAAVQVRDIQKGLEVLKFNSTRFFKRGSVKYEGRVHNQPIIEGEGLSVFNDKISIKHYGYDLTPEQKQKKFERTSGLLMKQIEEGEDKFGFPCFYLCQIYANNGQSAEAVKWGEKYLEYQNEEKFNESIYFTMIKQYMSMGDKENCARWLDYGIQKMPQDLDISIAAFEYGLWQNNDELVIHYGNLFMQLYSKFEADPIIRENRFVYALRPEAKAFVLMHLARVMLVDGSKALNNFVVAVKDCPEELAKGLMTDLENSLAVSAIPIKFVKGNTAVAEPAEQPKNYVTGNIG